jgi:hypothetical protein
MQLHTTRIFVALERPESPDLGTDHDKSRRRRVRSSALNVARRRAVQQRIPVQRRGGAQNPVKPYVTPQLLFMARANARGLPLSTTRAKYIYRFCDSVTSGRASTTSLLALKTKRRQPAAEPPRRPAASSSRIVHERRRPHALGTGVLAGALLWRRERPREWEAECKLRHERAVQLQLPAARFRGARQSDRLRCGLNEYHLTYGGDARGHWMIYHCPFCGGAAPRSKRETLFAQITDAESRRLHELTRDVRTVEVAIARFGPPDHDLVDGLTMQTPATDTEPSKVSSYRVLTYDRLSETADVHFTDYGPERGLRMTLQSKYIGKPGA